MTAAPPAGLCGVCEHARRIENRRGSVFFLCERARDDTRFSRYPALPVLRCAGFDPLRGDESGDDDAG